jgi:hypothetical protein
MEKSTHFGKHGIILAIFVLTDQSEAVSGLRTPKIIQRDSAALICFFAKRTCNTAGMPL